MIQRFLYVLKRLYSLGLLGSFAACKRKFNKQLWIIRNKKKTLRREASRAQDVIGKIKSPQLINLLGHIAQQELTKKILISDIFSSVLPPTSKQRNEILMNAHRAANHQFNLLGSGEIKLPTTIDWHHEFKKDSITKPFSQVNSFSYKAYADVFHTDVPIPQQEKNPNVYHEDVKILWDLGRMHHLTKLGQGFNETKDELFLKTFIQDVTSFQDQVSYLIGPHWKCPMDVAIRAINFIWCFDFFYSAHHDTAFWHRYLCMLFDHMSYLESNFELSDKSNNHLLADYVGYLYLAVFFSSLQGHGKRFSFIQKKLKQEFLRQIEPDGFAYEGSTAYHRLDCELLLHTISLLAAINLKDQALENLLIKMLENLSLVHDEKNNLITVGDDDSGSIVFGITPPFKKTAHPITTVKLPFGLALYKSEKLHVTLRGATISVKQPSGHFHHDTLGITIQSDKSPFIIDPGSFVYTANNHWRNFFKTAMNHSTFFIVSNNSPKEPADLFQTKLNYSTVTLTTHETSFTAQAIHVEGHTLTRTVHINSNEKTTIVTIEDSIKAVSDVVVLWRFILCPNLDIEIKNDTQLFLKNSIEVARCRSELALKIKSDAAAANGYGVFLPTKALEASVLTKASTLHSYKTIIEIT